MKVNANAMAAFQREMPPGKAVNKPEKAERTPQNEGAKPSVIAPPGLQKVMAKMEALGESRTQGQNVAMGRIERNLAKYEETQAIVATPQVAEDESPVGSVEVTPEAAVIDPLDEASADIETDTVSSTDPDLSSALDSQT